MGRQFELEEEATGFFLLAAAWYNDARHKKRALLNSGLLFFLNPIFTQVNLRIRNIIAFGS